MVCPSCPKTPFCQFNGWPEIIRLVVMMCVKFRLSLRSVEDILFERDIDICYETVRLWWNRFGQMFAAEIRRKRVAAMRAHTHWLWHFDEVHVKINGELHDLWRAVDHEGEVLESFVTVGPRSYGAALKEIGNADRQQVGRWLNNRAESSHQPFRRRERAMYRCRSMTTLQKFASVHAQFDNHFNQERHLLNKDLYRERRSAALAQRRSVMA